MSFSHTVRITELKKKKVIGSFNDVVVHCRWELKTTHPNYSGDPVTFSGATPFEVTEEDLTANGFTDISQVSEEQMVTWVEANAWNLPDLKKQNEDRIMEEIEQPFEVVQNPYQHDDVPSMDATPTVEENTEEENTTEEIDTSV